MSYSLILRPNSTDPACHKTLRDLLLVAGLNPGLMPGPVSVAAEVMRNGCALFQIVADSQIPQGLGVLVKIPYHRELLDFTLDILNLERISHAINAELIDGDEVLVHAGEAGLECLFALRARYERASECAAARFEIAAA